MKRRLPLVALVAALLALAGCGVPVSNTAAVLQGVPVTLLQPAGRPYHPPAGHASSNGSGVFDIYLVAGDSLVAVPRTGLPSGATPLDLEQLLLSDLEAGPRPGEYGEGITTQLPGGAQATIVSVHPASHGTPGVVTVNLDFSVDLPLIALAQIVWTLTDVENITEVTFYQAGKPVDTPIQTGAYEPGPLTEADYSRFKPAAVAPPSTNTSHPKAAQPRCSGSNPQSVSLGDCPS
jgi:hypothetical protein